MSKNTLQFSATAYGFVFMGMHHMTDEDLMQLKDYTRQDDPEVDPLSVVGRYDRDWSCEEEGLQSLGGEGSHTYQTQLLGEGVEFKDPDNNPAIFHVDPDRNYVHGVLDYPRTRTAFHRSELGTVAGPAPDSEAEGLLGDGTYVWNNDMAWWQIG